MNEDKLEFLSAKEAAEMLGISLGSVYGLINKGELPVIRFAGKKAKIRIHRRDLEPLMQSYYTPEQIAGMLRFHKVTVYDWIKKGMLRAIKIKSGTAKMRILKSDFDSFIEANKAAGPLIPKRIRDDAPRKKPFEKFSQENLDRLLFFTNFIFVIPNLIGNPGSL